MKKILITGSEGNIGTFITEQIQKMWPANNIIRSVFGTENKLTHNGIYVGDLRDPLFTKSIFKDNPDIEYVIHAAAKPYNAEFLKQEPFGIFSGDLLITINVLNACVTQNVKKIVYLSSATVYEGATELPFREEQTGASPPPSSPIGMSKLTGERAIIFANRQTGIDYTIWRLFNVVSPREDHSKSGAHVYVDFYRKLFVEHSPVLEIMGDGKQVRNFTWVEDVANVVTRYLEDPRSSGQTFNFGGEEPHSLLDLKDLFLKIGKENNLLPADYNPEIKTGETFFGIEAPKRIPSLEKIKTMLDWKNSTDFETCFKKFILEKQRYADT